MLYTANTIKTLIECDFLSFYKDLEINHVSTDSRGVANSINTLFFALKTDNGNGHKYINELYDKGVRNFVVSEEVEIDKANVFLVKDTLKALQLLAQKHREQFNVPVIGITGSYGKTIVKEWLYQLLKDDYLICRTPKSYNSQIGVPLSLLQLNSKHTLAIIEAGISQIGEMENLAQMIKPTIGVFTGIGEAHSSGFNSIEEKEHEKRKLFKTCEVVISNNLVKGTYDLPFKDKASKENCETCIAVLEYLGVNKAEIQKRINTLSPLALRLEMKKGKNKTTIVNDSYNISYASLFISIDYLNQQAVNSDKTIVISDIPDYDYAKNDLVDLLNKNNFKQVFTVGKYKLEGIETSYFHFISTSAFLDNISSSHFNNEFILIKGARNFEFEQISHVLEEVKHQTKLEINLSQLTRNLNYYKQKLNPETKIMVMTKAFAYGSGTTEIPKLLQFNNVNYIGVAYVDEGVELRKNGIEIPIIIMNPEPSTFNQLIDFNLEPEIYSFSVLDDFIRTLILKNRKDYPIHLKIDTGMNRLGFLSNQIQDLIAVLKSQPEVYVKTMFSHLSSADNEKEKEFTLSQINLFTEISSKISAEFSYKIDKHILNTAGIENYTDYQFDMVRLGIGLYGISVNKNNSELKPISELKSIVIQKKSIKKGDSVGYGRNYIAEKDMTIGIVPIGYADGFRRSLGNGNFSVLVNNQQAKTVGNICMDLCMIDITNINCKEEDEVEIFGNNNSIYHLANAMNTIPYEVLTSISQRVNRIFITE
jgi:alanine racemase